VQLATKFAPALYRKVEYGTAWCRTWCGTSRVPAGTKELAARFANSWWR